MSDPAASVRSATPHDMERVGQLLHDFNREYDDPTPEPAWLAERVARLIAGGDTVVLVAGEAPDAVAVMRFRESLWVSALECYLAELYVAPAHRGRGLGRALMEAVLRTARERGAAYIDLNTGETDTAARNLYESLGFSASEGVPGGPINIYYEREL
jgi:ribosomal protein S18 acetylase RimI-like enzyme